MEQETPELTLDYIRFVLAEDIRSDAGPVRTPVRTTRRSSLRFERTAATCPATLRWCHGCC